MKSIDILVEEHKYIKMVLKEIRRQCITIVHGGRVDYQLFYNVIDFVRNFADKYHHKKEEDRLFNIMAEQLGLGVESGPIAGMLVEHDLGRSHIMDLEKALRECEKGNADAKVDIIANAIGYEQLLLKHIEKEDNAIYRHAERRLSRETLEKLDEEFEAVEKDAENTATRNKYMGFANSLGSNA
ncbi:MAG TPA: hemerythrin domain-containing protein [Clostridia bacterium]|nr:hemerythrin domain-containing protein [Clostridia bacterium]